MVSALILIVGARFKPKKRVESAPSQLDVLRLQLSDQRRNLDRLTSYFGDVVNQVKSGLIWIHGLDASGVIWDANGGVVTAGPREPLTREPIAGPYKLTPELASVHFPVGSFRLPAEARPNPVFRTSPETIKQGSWVIQVAAKHDGGQLYAPGIFEGVTATDCGDFHVNTVRTSVPLDRSFAGSGVFDLSGNLLGVVVRCGEEYEAVTPAGLEWILEQARKFEARMLRTYGFSAEPMTANLRDHFKLDHGLLITEVWVGWPADVAGLAPGQIILTLDGAEANKAEDLSRMLLPEGHTSFQLTLAVGRVKKRIELPVSHGDGPAARQSGEPGIILRAPDTGYNISEVEAGSAAERASLRPGDRLLLVDGRRPRNWRSAQKALGGKQDSPLYLTVLRGRKMRGVLLE